MSTERCELCKHPRADHWPDPAKLGHLDRFVCVAPGCECKRTSMRRPPVKIGGGFCDPIYALDLPA